MSKGDRYTRRQQEKEDREESEFESKLQYFLNILKTKLGKEEDSIIENIITYSQKETWKFTYEWRKKAFENLQNDDLMKCVQDINISWMSPSLVVERYVSDLKRKILLDFPEYKIKDIMTQYYTFMTQKDRIKEHLIKSWSNLQEDMSDIELFVHLINCDEIWKKWIYNLLSLIKSIDLKVEREVLEEIAQERLKEALNEPTPQEKLINILWKDILNEFKSLIETEHKTWKIFPIFDTILHCINKINNKYNFRFSEEEINILTEIWQTYLKRLK